MNKTNLMVKVSFPEVTEIRIGSALRLVIGYYTKLNKISYEKVPKEKLIELLANLPNAYKYKTIMNYSNYVLNSLIGINVGSKKMEFEGINEVNEKSAEYGLSLIPIEMLTFLNTTILERILSIVLKSLSEEVISTYIVTIEKEEYERFFSSNGFDNPQVENAIKFIEGLKNWLEYNMIVRVNSFYIEPQTFNIVFPVRFSFIENLREE